MNLTVGPLPSAVYWRRRAIVLGGLLVVILLLAYSCGGSGTSDASSRQTAPIVGVTSPSPSTRPSLPTPTPSGTFVFPSTMPLSPGGPLASPTATGAAGLCTDAEMQVTTVITSTAQNTSKLQFGGTFDLKLKIRNLSDRACTRDVGSVPEELRVLDKKGHKVWSSDDCSPGKAKAHNVKAFAAGIEIYAELTWNTYHIAPNVCSKSATPAARGTYTLIGRLGSKTSKPLPFTIEN